MRNSIHGICKFLFIFVSIFLISCGSEDKAVAPPQQIPVVEVMQDDVPIFKEFVGQIYGYADIAIRARVAGFLEGIHFDEGLRVKTGQLLYTIDPEPFKAMVAAQQSILAEAKTEMVRAKSDLDRIKPLAKINAVSKSDLDAAQAEYDASVANVEAQQSNLEYANINLGYCWMKSPINGIIGKTEARVGEFVGKDPNPVILNTVSTVDSVRVEFFLIEADYIRLAKEFEARKENLKGNERSVLRLILADGSKFKHPGYVNFINRQVDPQTGSLLVQATFPNTESLLKPGQYAKVIVKMKEEKGALLIPQRCAMELQGLYRVYVVGADNKVESRQITIGEHVGDMYLVTKGLQAGEKVVIDALQKVSPGMEVNPQLTVYESKSNLQD